MARWTQTTQEQQHLARISEEMPIGGIARLELMNGQVLEGVLRRMNLGNNAGQGGWKYYGECELETKDRSRWVVDYLDIKSARNIWTDAIGAEYEALGLITIVK
jgi:hypothetical protein